MKQKMKNIFTLFLSFILLFGFITVFPNSASAAAYTLDLGPVDLGYPHLNESFSTILDFVNITLDTTPTEISRGTTFGMPSTHFTVSVGTVMRMQGHGEPLGGYIEQISSPRNYDRTNLFL